MIYSNAHIYKKINPIYLLENSVSSANFIVVLVDIIIAVVVVIYEVCLERPHLQYLVALYPRWIESNSLQHGGRFIGYESDRFRLSFSGLLYGKVFDSNLLCALWMPQNRKKH